MAATTDARIVPAFRYRDAHAAIEFLCTCRDPEGHVWSFGTYDPSAAHGS